jgi:hypothetical protein
MIIEMPQETLFIYDDVFQDEFQLVNPRNHLYFTGVFETTDHLHPAFIEDFLQKYNPLTGTFIRLSINNFHYFYSFEKICFKRLQNIYLSFKEVYNINLLNPDNVFDLSKRENISSNEIFDVVYFLKNRKLYLLKNSEEESVYFKEEFLDIDSYVEKLNKIALLFKNKLLTDIQKLSLFNVVTTNEKFIKSFFNHNFVKLEEVFKGDYIVNFEGFLKSSSCLKLLEQRLILKGSNLLEEITNSFRNYSNNSFEWFNFLNLFKRFIYKEEYLVLSPKKNLYNTEEYRLIVDSNNKIITASKYAVNGSYKPMNIDKNLNLINQFQEFIDSFNFFNVFDKQKPNFIVVDLIISEEKIFLLELNNIECSDLYLCEYSKLF